MRKKLWNICLLICLLGGLLLLAGCGKNETTAVAEPTEIQQIEETTEPATEGEESPVVEEPAAEVGTYQTSPVPEGKPKPVEPQKAEITKTELQCTLSISCETLLNHQELLDPDKVELVPADGWVLQPVKVTFQEGENVFQVLQQVCREEKIHLEYMDTPLYNSAYIEGIHNLYEFDAGDLSGWMYRVNGWFPNYGCSRYQLQDGDVIKWVYTCDLGQDVGGNNGARE